MRTARGILALILGAAVGGVHGLTRGRTQSKPTLPLIVPVSTNVTSLNGTTLPPLDTWYYFNQLIDHNDPSLGTFVQRYYFTYQNYLPGGPVILMTPGEINAEGYYGYLVNATINGLIAQQQNGATVVLEHRFYGFSNPYPDLTVASLRYHTLEQAVDDLVFFSRNVQLPMPDGDQMSSETNPWILIGGSYSGALTSWTMVNQPGAFWAAYASSAVVEAINYFWAYFEPIREFMPTNCSLDVERVISYVDNTFMHGTEAQQMALKIELGMPNVTHLDDVSGALSIPLGDWQDMAPDDGPGSAFYDFCDMLEVKDNVSAGPEGQGLQYALQQYGLWMVDWIEENCAGLDQDTCLGTYDSNQTFYTNTTIDNNERSWLWICCNYVGYWQVGAPSYWPTLVSRLLNDYYEERQCTYFFPEAFPTAPIPNNTYVNRQFAGWNVNVDRLFFANGWRDPWRFATVSSDFHFRASTPTQPIGISDGFHCSDLGTENGQVDETVGQVQKLALAYFKNWMAEYYDAHPTYLNPGVGMGASPATMPTPAVGSPVVPASAATATAAAVPSLNVAPAGARFGDASGRRLSRLP